MNSLKAKSQKRSWSSKAVALSLASLGGALAVSACEPEADTSERRNQYQSKAECVADYSERECEQQTRSGGGGFFFLGPIYTGNWRNRGATAYAGGGGPGRAALNSPNGVVAHPTQTTRGGFGSTGRSYSNRGG
jgi:hypothetical protein